MAAAAFLTARGFQKFRQAYPHLCVASHGSGVCASGSPSTSSSSSSSLSSSSSRQDVVIMDEDGRPSIANPVYEQGDPVEILEHLFLGSAFHAANVATLDRLGVTALINVSRSRPALDADAIGVRFAYKSIPVDDSNSVDISSWFSEAIKFIDDVKESGGKVLVHCHAGISRSATICLAYLMFTRRIRLDEAYEYIKTRRSVISPNFNFMGQLLKFESQLMLSPDINSLNSSSDARRQRHHHGHQQRPHESCLLSTASEVVHQQQQQQRFVFPLGVSEDRGYSSSSVASSASLSPSPPMLTAPAIMSPS